LRKGLISILAGIVIGVLVAYNTLDYEGWTIQYTGADGEVTRAINELDVDLLLDSLLIVVGSSAFIYVIWSMIEKGRKNRSAL
jgi:hypothetical protein